MMLPTSVRPSVSPDAIQRVGRLFNGSIDDILNELVQNARRAGATCVFLENRDRAGQPVLAVRDDGCGIDDPGTLVTLGRSGWSSEIAAREDPAGMGVFSLAGHHVEIRSYSHGADAGWRLTIPADAWEGRRALSVEPFAIDRGTEILIDLPDAWNKSLLPVARNVARFYPLPLHLDGEELSRVNWLADAIYVEEWQGVRIGIVEGGFHRQVSRTINFHGLTVPCVLARVAEADGNRSWEALVDIVDAPQLQLVLPARKEMVQNSALDALKLACRHVIFRAIAASGPHTLAFSDWAEARDAGIALPAAEARLTAWTPATADPDTGRGTHIIAQASNAILMPDFRPAIAPCADRAFQADGRFAGRLADEKPAFEGYDWYDALPRVADLSFRLTRGDEVALLSLHAGPEMDEGQVDSIQLAVTLHEDGREHVVTIPADVAIHYDAWEQYDFEEADIYVSASSQITPDDLADLLTDCCFCSSDDRNLDSWQTQFDRFRVDALEQATRFLLGDDEAVLARLRCVLADNVAWIVPDGRAVSVQLRRNEIEVQFVPEPAD
ncbi:ATP-binding protein [Sphingobium sp. AS12]|uniref:ATP-binding protein n=1 Tax=Sphingobium sp. AS12 TaxID=2849495 RepID=UPI001C3173B6|nr:ATP-binding protein [Sphingobium sp. AS12]MBV2149934.1 ATP-binding protein [Sphingobium sp. AS12]